MEQHINGNEHLYSYLYVSLSDPLNTSQSPDWLVKPQIKPLQLIEAFMEYGCLSKAISNAILASLDVYVCKASIRRRNFRFKVCVSPVFKKCVHFIHKAPKHS